MSLLREYQDDIIADTRQAMRSYKRILQNLPTGAGKTVTTTDSVRAIYDKGLSAWFVVPRKALVKQSHRHFCNSNIPHGFIAAGRKHTDHKIKIVSKDTLIRRLDDVEWPDVIFVDEAHVNYSFQVELVKRIPRHVYVIGLSATPERLSGEGLSDIYQTMVSGPTLAELIADGWLSPLRYLAPPLKGLDKLKPKGTEYDEKDLEKLFAARFIYGKVVDTYRQVADKKPCLIFCRGVKEAETWTKTFNDAGYKFVNLDWSTKDAKRDKAIADVESGKLDGIVSVDLISYGFDCPKIECVILLRPTESRALYNQMIGRGLRIMSGKKELIVLDFVNNLATHGHPLSEHEWNFAGTKKSKRKGQSEDILHVCPECFYYSKSTVCPSCGYEKETTTPKGLKQVDGRLVEHKGPLKLSERTENDRKAHESAVESAIARYAVRASRGEIDREAIKELVELGKSAGHKILWTYHRLKNQKRISNIYLLQAMQKILGYKSGWAKMVMERWLR